MIKYLNRRTSDAAVEQVSWKGGTTFLWSSITEGLAKRRYLNPSAVSEGIALDDLSAALWRLCVLPRQVVIQLSVCDAALAAVVNAGHSQVSSSLIPLIKVKIFDALRFNHHTARTPKSDLALQLRHHAFPSETAVDIPPDLDIETLEDEAIDAQLDPLYSVLSDRITEGRVQLLAQFLENCADTVFPYDPVKTLSVLGSFAPAAQVHASHQIRLATSLKNLSRRRPALLKAVINIAAFDVYASSAETEKSRAIGGWLQSQPWLDDADSRDIVKHCLARYSRALSGTDSAALGERVDSILDGLDYLHREMGNGV
ncbi:hypothetical protein C8R44DRAFT_883705 [Mycena epipterygia]|nr:hypothetical protein C8R44DRAFT_883705 [Mycena epipterygia]